MKQTLFNSLFLLLALVNVSVSSNLSSKKLESKTRLPSILNQTSKSCNRNGFLVQGKCICFLEYEPSKNCKTTRLHAPFVGGVNNKCSKMLSRMDTLFNVQKSNLAAKDFVFPESKASIGSNRFSYGSASGKWKRISEIFPNTPLFGSEVSADDLKQGALGDCYFLGALAGMAEKDPNLIKDLFLTKEKNKEGIYVTRWYVDGTVRLISVNDYVVVNKKNEPSFASTFGSSVKNGFWPMILEKAYAKLNGSYKKIESGRPEDAWRNLLQAYATRIIITNKNEYETLKLARKYAKLGILNASTFTSSRGVDNHIYAVLGIYDVGSDWIYKLYNPWAKTVFKINLWRDGSSRWTEKIQKQVNYNSDNDGIFYLSSYDFKENFSSIFYTAVSPKDEYIAQTVELKRGNKNYDYDFTVRKPGPIYIIAESPEPRQTNGMCKKNELYKVTSLKLISTPNKKNVSPHLANISNRKTLYIQNAIRGNYRFRVSINSPGNSAYTGIGIYAKKGIASWKKNNPFFFKNVAACPRDCNKKGFCLSATKSCLCYNGKTNTNGQC